MQGLPRQFITLTALLAAGCFLSGCSGSNRRDPALMEVFAGPIELEIRDQLVPGSKTVAKVKHGATLEVLGTRRRFVRVRTPSNLEGWTDARLLLTAEEMQELRALEKRAGALPSQGEATVFDPLNMHPAPSRSALGFYQITEGVKVDVLLHRQAPREGKAGRLTLPLPKREAPARRRRARKERPVTAPLATAPALPGNWLALSKTNLPPPTPEEIALSLEAERKRKAAEPPLRTEDWNLVRTKDGRAGWVLANSLVMAIPDEVAQYSEGKRITSYFSLGTVEDGGQTKHHWLWTTIGSGSHPYQFDSFRVFMWIPKRHRYETIYIERDVKGYYPIAVWPGKAFRFRLVTEEEDGQFWQEMYEFQIYLVKMIDKRLINPATPAATLSSVPEIRLQPESKAQAASRRRGDAAAGGERN